MNPTRIGIVLSTEPADAAILESLRQIGLYESAIARCQAAIAVLKPGTMTLARWNAWLVATIAERDAESSTTIEGALSQAKKVHEALITDEKSQAFAVWNQYSFERVRYDLVNRSVASYLAAPSNITKRDDALQTLRDIVDQLEVLDARAEDQMGKTFRKNERESSSIARDLASLRNRISLLEIDCLLLHSQCYPLQSNESIGAGTKALAAIEKMAGRVEAEWDGHELLDLARFQSLVAINRFSDAEEGLLKWLPKIADTKIRLLAIALTAKACQSQGNFQGAKRYLSLAPDNALGNSPEIALALLELQIAAWQKQKSLIPDQQLSIEVVNQNIELMLKTKDQIAERFGSYWKQRAEAVIVSSSLEPAGTNQTPSIPASLELLKMEIRQRLAAGDLTGAIVRLEQAEIASCSLNDFKQAFLFAKSAMGLAHQQSIDIGSTPEQLQVIVDRISKTAKKYSDQDGAASLDQMAIEQQKNLIAKALGDDVVERSWKRFQQLLSEHIDVWQNEVTSIENRRRLQTVLLSNDEQTLLIDLYSAELSSLKTTREDTPNSAIENYAARLQNAQLNLVNALLLESFTAGSNEDRSKVVSNNERMEALTATQCAIFQFLNGDFDWWDIDGGIRPNDSQPLDSIASSSELNEDGILTTVRRIALAAMKPDSRVIETDIQAIVDWFRNDPASRIGWMVSLSSTLSNIVRVRNRSDLSEQERQRWSTSLSQLNQSIHLSLTTDLASIHPRLQKSLSAWNAIVEARCLAYRSDNDQGTKLLENFRASESRSTRWILELARFDEILGQANLNKALQRYRQLAAGTQIGSDIWFESRLSSARCLRRMEQKKEADEIVGLVRAMVDEIPEKWKRRIK